jgi:cation:H+ antiporter
VRLDLPILLAASLALYVLVADGRLGRLDGALLFGGCIAYTLFSVRLARAERGPGDSGESAAVGGTMGRDVVVIVAGLAVLLLGARWFVDGASEMARNFGVSELVIGLTIVAVGTSLPEVATSVVAAMRGEPDFVVGNVVGSNLMNILCILGTTSLVAPGGIEVPGPVEEFDLPIMIGAAFALLPLTLAGGRLGRRGGAFFLGVYVLYSTALFLRATESGALPTFRTVMLGFALPLVTGALIVIFVRGLLRRREEESRG